MEGVKTEEDLAGPAGLLKQITKAPVERMLGGELTHHLGHLHAALLMVTEMTRFYITSRVSLDLGGRNPADYSR